MKTRSGQKIKLTSVEELLGVPNEEVATEIDLVQIRSFKNHPFKVIDDEKMQDLISEILLLGLIYSLFRFHASGNNFLICLIKFFLSTAFGPIFFVCDFYRSRGEQIYLMKSFLLTHFHKISLQMSQ